jgi:trimeric autotransporter adhesin
MKTIRTLLLFIILGAGLPYFSHATLYTVNTTADAGTGAAGIGDLRYCMTQAFADATLGPHTIRFAIGAGPQTITLANDLPQINGENGIIIDATTQPGYVNKPLITLSRVGGNNGFSLQTSSNITIKGFAITGFQRGFMIDNACTFITILNNYINLNQAGNALVAPPAGGSAIFIQNSTDITIGAKGKNNRNIIVGAGNHGIEAVGTSARITIKNNFIGVYENGTSAAVLGAANHGIFLNGTDNCVIDSNVISNNTQDGILADATAINCFIRYNKIGTDSTGLVPAGNRKEGILVQNSTGAVIQYNVISANLVNGILIEGPSNNSIIQGNKIGVNINGVGTWVTKDPEFI